MAGVDSKRKAGRGRGEPATPFPPCPPCPRFQPRFTPCPLFHRLARKRTCLRIAYCAWCAVACACRPRRCLWILRAVLACARHAAHGCPWHHAARPDGLSISHTCTHVPAAGFLPANHRTVLQRRPRHVPCQPALPSVRDRFVAPSLRVPPRLTLLCALCTLCAAPASLCREFYFSVENLVKDVFLRKNMDAEGYVPVHLLLTFRRLNALCSHAPTLMEAISLSPVLEVDVENEKIRLRDQWHQVCLPLEPFRPLVCAVIPCVLLVGLQWLFPNPDGTKGVQVYRKAPAHPVPGPGAMALPIPVPMPSHVGSPGIAVLHSPIAPDASSAPFGAPAVGKVPLPGILSLQRTLCEDSLLASMYLPCCSSLSNRPFRQLLDLCRCRLSASRSPHKPLVVPQGLCQHPLRLVQPQPQLLRAVDLQAVAGRRVVVAAMEVAVVAVVAVVAAAAMAEAVVPAAIANATMAVVVAVVVVAAPRQGKAGGDPTVTRMAMIVRVAVEAPVVQEMASVTGVAAAAAPQPARQVRRQQQRTAHLVVSVPRALVVRQGTRLRQAAQVSVGHPSPPTAVAMVASRASNKVVQQQQLLRLCCLLLRPRLLTSRSLSRTRSHTRLSRPLQLDFKRAWQKCGAFVALYCVLWGCSISSLLCCTGTVSLQAFAWQVIVRSCPCCSRSRQCRRRLSHCSNQRECNVCCMLSCGL